MHFAHPIILLLGSIVLAITVFYKKFLQKLPVYRYTLTHKLKESKQKKIVFSRSFFMVIRLCFFSYSATSVSSTFFFKVSISVFTPDPDPDPDTAPIFSCKACWFFSREAMRSPMTFNMN